MNRVGAKFIFLDVVDSTNNYLSELVKQQDVAHGTIVVANEQTNGRGQRGTTWNTQPGMNLILSCYLEFSGLSVEKQNAIHHFVACSVNNLIKRLGVESKIKWPNDILTPTGKIAGILIENSLVNASIKHTIIGIGLNVNQTAFGDLKATSLKCETGNFFNIQEVVFMLTEELNRYYELLENQQFGLLNDLYHQHLWKRGEYVAFHHNGVLKNGTLIGTDDRGMLLMDVEGQQFVFDLKEIQFSY